MQRGVTHELKLKLQPVGKRVKLEKLFQAPPLPSYYVNRPEYSQDLKTRLLTESNDVRTLVVTAIHGLGSVGKSTLATALAHDLEVQTHFCDGILWATLGQQPNLISLLSGWVQALGDYNFKATSVEAASNQLRTLLYDKAVLLVVDDAWNTQDAQAFNVGGARCQVLVTTREAAIAEVLGACTYSLDVMKPSQAMELLTNKLGREIIEAESQSASDLAKAVGYLPLALELVAAEVASGTTWTQLLEDFQLEVVRLKTLDRPEAEEITDEAILKRFSLTASLNLSVKRMPTKKQQHFSWLGVLPEDVTITKMMAATLWEIDERDTAKTLQYMYNKALLLPGVPLTDGTPTYRLHDLFHDLACNLLTAPTMPEDDGDLLQNLLPEALAAAREIQSERRRAKALSSLVDELPPDLLPEVLAAAREIQSEEDRAKALSSLADKLPELLPEVLAAAREIESARRRAEALTSLAGKLLQLQKTPLFSLWRETLHILSVHTRPNLLTDINALTPVIFALGDKQAMKDTANAIQDVSRWWG